MVSDSKDAAPKLYRLSHRRIVLKLITANV